MDFYLKVKEFLAENAKEKDFTGGISEDKILKLNKIFKSHFQIATNGFLETMVLAGFMELIY